MNLRYDLLSSWRMEEHETVAFDGVLYNITAHLASLSSSRKKMSALFY